MIGWMDGQSAPEAVLELLAYKRTQECTLPICVCMANGLNCTVCSLQDCNNRSPISDNADIAHEDASEDTSDSDSDY